MRFSRVLILLASLAILSGALLAQPRVDAVQNNYSYLLPGNPNYGIAQGSIFIIKGANLGNATTSLQNPPLQTTLNGVSAKVTVAGTTRDVLFYYVTPGQLGAILPSNTPVGNGTITVTNNGQTSAPAAIQVVKSAFGILTLNGSGSGAAAVQNASDNYQLLSTSRSAKPGDYLVIYGSGIGPAEDDNSPAPRDMTEIATTVELGGVSIPVLYRGRTAFAGLDQINIQLPANAATGCDVTLVVKNGSISSNSTTIPVAANGGTCTPSTNPGGGSNTNEISQADIEKWIASGQFRVGSVTLDRTTSYSSGISIPGVPSNPTVETKDTLTGAFLRISGSDLQKVFTSSYVTNLTAPAAGQCQVIPVSLTNPFPGLTVNIGYLDAGPQLSVTGPNGNKTAPRQSIAGTISYSGDLSTGTPGYMTAGSYTISGPGGADVGAFSAALTLANPLTWSNRASIAEVNRSQGLTVTWTGGDPNTLVNITGSSFTLQGSTPSGATFICWARNSAGSFTVPANILNQLPASTSISQGPISFTQPGTLAVGSSGSGVRAQATGVDYLIVNYDWTTSTQVPYK
jgi:uncharacterized protein (TIGR03437 family)